MIRLKNTRIILKQSYMTIGLLLQKQRLYTHALIFNRKFATTFKRSNSSISHQQISNNLIHLSDVEIDSIQNLLNNSLEKLKFHLENKSLDLSYNLLNEASISEKLEVYESIKLRLSEVIYKDSSGSIENITLVDFINPNWKNILPLVYLLANNKYPKTVLELNNANSSSDLLSKFLQLIAYNEFLKGKIESISTSDTTIDLSNPIQWFPEARKMKRKIIMHVGPTNSGKTYNSLLKLSKSKTGYYAGPLRLLAREIYEKFNLKGIGCNLITGEEVIPSINNQGQISGISSGTIEMIPLHKKMDLCVIDEIQMIADSSRGSVWTNALLGVQAKEIHLCGEEGAVPFVENLVKTTGDELEIKHFKRLGKLSVEKKPIDLRNLKKGDCLVVFSKRRILEFKCKIEQETDLKVAIIYGALPPEIRSQEAAKFNNGDYDVLVASDAIGMGLNLKIKRIVFSGINKFDGNGISNLSVSQVKQIAGRAGRFDIETGAREGFVTALQRSSLVYIKECLKEANPKITKACLWPIESIWRKYMSNYSTSKPLSDILEKFEHDFKDHKMKDYFISDTDSRLEILKLISNTKQLKIMSIDDQLILSESPINLRFAKNNKILLPTVVKFFKCIVDRDCKSVFDFKFLNLELLSKKSNATEKVKNILLNVQVLEDMHKLLLLFMWLSQRWPTFFIDKESSMEVKAVVEKRITEELTNIRRINKLHTNKTKFRKRSGR
ncbi:unnamed protein product [Candida verbasci]|uniref:ATP-dependent RNA helicase SUV3, mitochondrial n=1 Tax=Candida verbasci TaxID=1227364 RepID=A0A9W4TU71_9ASCO|nr:unnamed protein product [Candida verbasci]